MRLLACSEQSEGIFCAPRNDLLYEIATLRSQRRIATLPIVARNDMGSSNFGTMLNYK